MREFSSNELLNLERIGYVVSSIRGDRAFKFVGYGIYVLERSEDGFGLSYFLPGVHEVLRWGAESFNDLESVFDAENECFSRYHGDKSAIASGKLEF
jgi:hypothetical protein